MHLRAWVDPCPHALAAAYQVAWLADADPFVLLAAARAAARGAAGPAARAGRPASAATRSPDDVALAVDAATRARRILELLERGETDIDHLL